MIATWIGTPLRRRVAEPDGGRYRPAPRGSFAELLAAAAYRGRGTPASLAQALGLREAEIHAWLRGAALPDPGALRALAELLEIDPDRLLAALERQRR